jgi:hypothetical protein
MSSNQFVVIQYNSGMQPENIFVDSYTNAIKHFFNDNLDNIVFDSHHESVVTDIKNLISQDKLEEAYKMWFNNDLDEYLDSTRRPTRIFPLGQTKNVTAYRDIDVEVEITTNTKVKTSVGDFNNSKTKSQKFKIKGENIDKLLPQFSYECGYDLTPQQMLEIIVTDINLIEDSIARNVTELDTCTRDLFCECFGEYLIGKHWPKGGDSKEYAVNFFKELDAKANELKYTKIS